MCGSLILNKALQEEKKMIEQMAEVDAKIDHRKNGEWMLKQMVE